MSLGMLYAIGTLLSWIGWFFAFRAAYSLLQILFQVEGLDRSKHVRNVAVWSGIAALGLAVGFWLPSRLDKEPTDSLVLPLVWFVMPYSAWLGALCAAFLVVRGIQAWFAINRGEQVDRLKAAALWLVGVLVFAALYLLDPKNSISILRGGIPFSFQTAAALIFGILASMTAMIWAARAVKSRGLAKGVVNQVALIAGSVVFGLPFAFLVITSFKEDRDMSSPNGIVWVPRVQETVPYNNPKNPLYEAELKGRTVKGVVVEERPGGIVKLDVQEPLAIRGTTFETQRQSLVEVPRMAPVFTGTWEGTAFKGFVAENLEDGRYRIQAIDPPSLKGKEAIFNPSDVEPVRNVGLLTKNYPDALGYLPPETNYGLVYVKNTLILVVSSVLGTILSSSIVAYAFSRMKFPGRDFLFGVLLATMMLPGAVTLLPQFLIFRAFGWIDTLYPLWVPTFFASAFNVFLLRQFFKSIPMELEDAAKIDGCSYFKSFWSIMLPQIKPALAVIAIWTFMGAWNNFMGPLIYVNSPENMPLSYALQLFSGDRGGEPGMLMAFTTLTVLPVLLLFFFAQKYFIEGVTLSGFGGR